MKDSRDSNDAIKSEPKDEKKDVVSDFDEAFESAVGKANGKVRLEESESVELVSDRVYFTV